MKIKSGLIKRPDVGFLYFCKSCSVFVFQMFLADDAVVDVIVSSVVAPDHIFVQQPNCDSFQFLQMQNCLMQSCYEQSTTNVPLPRPVLGQSLLKIVDFIAEVCCF
jgi:hypothetical protein